jgi:hypothetical protein
VPSAALCLIVALGVGSFGVAAAEFAGSTSNDGNQLAAAATFPRYPEAVTADSPSFEVAVYPSQLSDEQVRVHACANH